jgi:hypothetical protein
MQIGATLCAIVIELEHRTGQRHWRHAVPFAVLVPILAAISC